MRVSFPFESSILLAASSNLLVLDAQVPAIRDAQIPQLAGVRLNSVSTHGEENHRRFPEHTAAKHHPSFYWKFPSGQEPASSSEKHSVLPLVRLGSTAQRHPQLGWMFRSCLGTKLPALLGSEGSPQPLGWGGRAGEMAAACTTTGGGCTELGSCA